MTPYLMPRADWAAALERRGCEFVRNAAGIENKAELWRSPAGVFLVPYVVIADEDERRVADYSLKKIIATLDGRTPRKGGNGAAGA